MRRRLPAIPVTGGAHLASSSGYWSCLDRATSPELNHAACIAMPSGEQRSLRLTATCTVPKTAHQRRGNLIPGLNPLCLLLVGVKQPGNQLLLLARHLSYLTTEIYKPLQSCGITGRPVRHRPFAQSLGNVPVLIQYSNYHLKRLGLASCRANHRCRCLYLRLVIIAKRPGTTLVPS